MDIVQSALYSFKELTDYSYKFEIAYSKTLHDVDLTFEDSDFYHIAGFQYLIDIDIPKNSKILFDKINNNIINEQYVSSSEFYEKVKDNYANVKQRISKMCYIRNFLDNDNIVCKYVKYMNRYSTIRADYMIKSKLNNETAYIFIRQRRQSNSFCICSFFLEHFQQYHGIKVYWMYKARINNITNEINVIYQRNKDNMS